MFFSILFSALKMEAAHCSVSTRSPIPLSLHKNCWRAVNIQWTWYFPPVLTLHCQLSPSTNEHRERVHSLVGHDLMGRVFAKHLVLQTYTVIVPVTSRFPEICNCWIYWVRTARLCDIIVTSLWCRCYCIAVNCSVCHLSEQSVTYLASIQSRRPYSPLLSYYLVHSACKRISQSAIRSYFKLIIKSAI